jgi:hypothetical protein
MRMRYLSLASSAALLVALTACGESEAPAPPNSERIPVTSDREAQYYLLSQTPMPNGHREAMIQRNGARNYTSFLRLGVDCAGATTATQLGSGTMEEARQGREAQPAAIPERGSIRSELVSFICSR